MRRYALRDDRWGRIEGLLPGARGRSGSRPRTTARSSRRCPTATGPASPGATRPSGSGPGGTSTPAFAAGPGAGSGGGPSSARPATRATNMPWSTARSSAPAGTAPARQKRWRGRRGDRARPRRAGHDDPRHRRRARRPDRLRAPAGAGARPGGRRRAAAGLGRGRADRRRGVRRRGARAPPLEGGRQDRGDPARGGPQGPASLRQGPLPGAAPDRELLRQAEAAPGDRHPPRQARRPLPGRHPPRGRCGLAQSRTRPRACFIGRDFDRSGSRHPGRA
jgi:hypothetical protein